MRNKKCFVCTASAVLLFGGIASAQVPPTRLSPTVPPKPAPSTVVPTSSAMEDMLAKSPNIPPALAEWLRKTDASGRLSMKGDLEAQQGDWADAVKDYRQALEFFPDESGALYGLGDDSLNRGDFAAAVPYYCRAIYASPNPNSLTPIALQPRTFRESNAFRVMEYARLLSLIGQQQEALTVYRHGAQMLNYMDGHPRTGLMLPDFGDGPGQIAFTPQRLQALAQVGWAKDHSDFDVAGAGARLQQAVALFPDSPVPYFYRGRYAARYRRDFKAVKADFDKAEQLGDAVAVDAVQQERHFFRNFLPAATQGSQQGKPNP